jgi:hypothetical protein
MHRVLVEFVDTNGAKRSNPDVECRSTDRNPASRKQLECFVRQVQSRRRSRNRTLSFGKNRLVTNGIVGFVLTIEIRRDRDVSPVFDALVNRFECGRMQFNFDTTISKPSADENLEPITINPTATFERAEWASKRFPTLDGSTHFRSRSSLEEQEFHPAPTTAFTPK